MTVTTCEHFGRLCPGHHCTCRCDSCNANVVRDLGKQGRRQLKDAEKKGKRGK